jgi:HAD superfamily hydrolase (TIGR01549 family)
MNDTNRDIRSTNTLARLRAARWLFFDVGSTLLDEDLAAADLCRQVSEILRGRGVERSPEQVADALTCACVERAVRQFFGMLERLDVTDEREQRAVFDALRYRHDLERPYPGVVDAIRRLSKHYKLGVIANQYLGTAKRLERHGMGGCFSGCCSSQELRVSKPDPRIFQIALEESSCAPRDAVMIGDRYDNDVRPAKALGMMTVRVRTGPTALLIPLDELETPDLTVGSVAEFAALLLAAPESSS